MAIQVVDITKGFAAHLAPVVLLDGFGRFLGHILLRHITHCRRRHDTCAGGNRGGCSGEDVGYRGGVRRVAIVLSWHGGDHRYHGGGGLGCLLRTRHHLDAGVAGLMTAQVVTVAEGLVAVATYKRCFAFVFLLYHRHWWPLTSSTCHIVFEVISNAGRWLLVYLDGQDRLLVNLFISCIEEW